MAPPRGLFVASLLLAPGLAPGQTPSTPGPPAAPAEAESAGAVPVEAVPVEAVPVEAGPAAARPPAPPAQAEGTPLSLAEALELALVRSYALQVAELDRQDAVARIDAAWGSVYPSVDLSARYVRNLRVANPFAGSAAGGFFSGLDAIGWLAYNESARQAGGPTLTLAEYNQRIAAGQRDAGITLDPDRNPFLVENQITAGLAITQTLYNGAAFAAIRGAEAYQRQVEAGIRQRQQEVARDVARAYYGALLAEAQAEVTAAAIERARETAQEITERVAQGVLPLFQQLSAEVELANLETSLIQARAGAEAAHDRLKLAIGLPPGQALRLQGALRIEDRLDLVRHNLDDALAEAERQRPDLEELRRTRELLRVQSELTGARFLPVLTAFANLGLIGTVPDDRNVITQDPMDPFRFSQRTLGPFDGAYWFDTSNLGLNLSWNLFDGFQTSQQQQRDAIELRRIDLSHRQALDGLRAELRAALRGLKTAEDRLATVDKTVARAELNYAHAKARVEEGVSTRLELREASNQLDQSQLNRLQAVHDYLAALVAYRIALGRPPAGRAAQESRP